MARVPVTPHLKKSPGRRRTKEQMNKDAAALDLQLQGKTLKQICEAQGYNALSSAHHAIKRALLDRQRNAYEQMDHFTIAVESLQRAIAYHEQVMATPHYVVSTTGKVVLDPVTNEPMLDPAPGQRSAAALERLYDQRNKLHGNYAPTKTRQEVVTEDVVDAEIKKLAEEVTRMQGERAVPSE